MSEYKLYLGSCLDHLEFMPDNSVDSIVTDPPYGLSFMGKKWDYDVPAVEIWAECLRVLKPGGHLLAFAGTRTQHRMACNIEDAGFEIRDMIAWVYGSGFPKSHNLKNDWEGWGTALKPALEPVTVARKPFKGTAAANVLEHGTGAINIDGCRVGNEERSYSPKGTSTNASMIRVPEHRLGTAGEEVTVTGRWPANVIHDGSDQVLAAFPDAAGQQGALTGNEPSGKMGHANCYGRMDRRHEAVPRIESDKSAARFFYCAKASKKDRGEGNTHPTVKPTELMAYLCRLVTPPGGIVLDPFMGSGSTGKAALREGFGFIGMEMDPDYFEIAKTRIKHEANKNTR